jgi:4-amino-4-deoxy-L-arabinose transferase-like glycosyltransferase
MRGTRTALCIVSLLSRRRTRLAGGWPPGPAWIALAAAGLIGLDLGARALTTNDLARFPLLAQDILVRCDWLRPQLNGAGYFNKPPLLAWLIALASWPVGRVTEWTAVLPSAAAVVATVLLTYALARDLFDPETGRFAALLAMTTQGLFFSAQLTMPDALMTCFITASVWMLVRMTLEPARPWWIGFYGCAGLAFWSKGPAGLLPLAVGLAYWLATRARRRWPLRPAGGVAIVGGLVALWWLLGVTADRQAVTQAVLVDQLDWYRPRGSLLVLLTAPLRSMAVALLPWGLLAPLAIPAAIIACREGERRRRVSLPLVWLAVTVALVALSHEQRLRYYVPVVPPMAVVTAWWLGSWLDGWATGGTARPHLSRVAAVEVWRILPIVWMVTALALALGYHGEVARHNAAGLAPVAARLKLIADGSVVLAWGIPPLPLAFYLDRPVIGVRSEAQLRAALERHPRAVVVAAESTWARRRAVEAAAVPEPAEGPRVVLVKWDARRR